MLTALRLARSGHAVALVEADRLGSGATSANHGMVHSGALYVRLHPHVVRHCRQAQAAFSALVGDAELPTDETVYVVRDADVADFCSRLDQQAIGYRTVDPDDVCELDQSARRAHRLLAIGERVFSSRRIVATLAGQCLAAGVTVVAGAVVDGVAHTADKVTGVRLASEQLHARHVVIAAGTGAARLLSDLGSRQAPLLKSRLGMMIHLPAARLRRGLIFASPDCPVIMPALGGGALTSYYGGVQPEITGRRAFPVDLGRATRLLDETLRALTPAIADPDGAVGYVAGKTDYVGTAYAEKGMINPGYHMIDHEAADHLHGLYTVITGKMTLGFHVSKAVADAILGTDLPLVMHPEAAPDTPARLLAAEPWAPSAQLLFAPMQDPDRPIVTTAVSNSYTSPWWTVEEHAVIDVDGKPGMYNVLRCRDSVSVLAMTGDDFWLIREYKYAMGRHIWQLPSGSIDKGEEPLPAGARELLEETGLTADTWIPLGLIHLYPTNVISAVHLFLAHDARPVQAPEPGIELVRTSRSSVRRLIADKEITHAASLVCLLTHLASA